MGQKGVAAPLLKNGGQLERPRQLPAGELRFIGKYASDYRTVRFPEPFPISIINLSYKSAERLLAQRIYITGIDS